MGRGGGEEAWGMGETEDGRGIGREEQTESLSQWEAFLMIALLLLRTVINGVCCLHSHIYGSFCPIHYGFIVMIISPYLNKASAYSKLLHLISAYFPDLGIKLCITS